MILLHGKTGGAAVCISILLCHHFHFPAQLVYCTVLVGGFTHSDLLDKAVVTGVVLFPRRYVPSFLWRIGFSIATDRRFS